MLFTVVEGDRSRARSCSCCSSAARRSATRRAALAALAPEIRRNGMLEHEGMKVFAEVYGPPPRLVVVGAVDTAEALCAAAGLLGWHTICVDARALFATPSGSRAPTS